MQTLPVELLVEFQRLVRKGERVSLLRRDDGYCFDFSPAWVETEPLRAELLGWRWLEYIENRDRPKLLAWLRDDSPGPFFYRGRGVLNHHSVKFTTVLVKHCMGNWALCGGDCRPWRSGDAKFFK